ncbi:MAG: helix-turn-helix domain-containing protein [Niastella sp.]|nr:helix-turn-helix domain-containing protein [Niastella sp.]
MDTPFAIIELTAEMKGVVTGIGEPHRHDFEEVIIVTQGNPYYLLDAKKVNLSPPIAVYVALGKVHKFIPDIDTRGYAVKYTNEFIPQSNFHFYSNSLDCIKYPLSSGSCATDIVSLCEIMLHEYSKLEIGYKVIKHLLSAFLLKLETEGDKHYGQNTDTKNGDLLSFNTFLRILKENFREHKGVDFYASKMNTTARSLNNITHAVLNMSVTEIIETRKLVEARQLLIHTNKTISEIGFELGYNEKSHFTRVFHKKTGLTPSDYKTKMRAILA